MRKNCRGCSNLTYYLWGNDNSRGVVDMRRIDGCTWHLDEPRVRGQCPCYTKAPQFKNK